MLSLQVIVMLALGRNVFVAKEALVVILLVAISMAVILLLVVAVFLIHTGIRGWNKSNSGGRKREELPIRVKSREHCSGDDLIPVLHREVRSFSATPCYF